MSAAVRLPDAFFDLLMEYVMTPRKLFDTEVPTLGGPLHEGEIVLTVDTVPLIGEWVTVWSHRRDGTTCGYPARIECSQPADGDWQGWTVIGLYDRFPVGR
jgi:hypothetical protein